MFKKLVAIEPVSLIPTAEEALHHVVAVRWNGLTPMPKKVR